MNSSAYQSYSHEVSSWLHTGRSHLIQKVLSWYLTEPAVGREILEVGAGVGQNIKVLNKFGHIDALELDPLGLASLRQIDVIRNVYDIGIPSDLGRKWDVILACDVIEHIEDDRLAVQWIFDHLKPGGIFFATVPAFQWLFSEHDIALGHYRRYTAEAFDNLLPEESNRLSGSYFNSYLFPLGLASRMTWQLGRRLSKRSNGESQKQRVPNGRFIDPILRSIFMNEIEGLSIKKCRNYGLSYYVCASKRM
jgi:SAM-dependent methyltransferase